MIFARHDHDDTDTLTIGCPEISVSPTGRSVRVWVDGKEVK